MNEETKPELPPASATAPEDAPEAAASSDEVGLGPDFGTFPVTFAEDAQ